MSYDTKANGAYWMRTMKRGEEEKLAEAQSLAGRVAG